MLLFLFHALLGVVSHEVAHHRARIANAKMRGDVLEDALAARLDMDAALLHEKARKIVAASPRSHDEQVERLREILLLVVGVVRRHGGWAAHRATQLDNPARQSYE